MPVNCWQQPYLSISWPTSRPRRSPTEKYPRRWHAAAPWLSPSTELLSIVLSHRTKNVFNDVFTLHLLFTGVWIIPSCRIQTNKLIHTMRNVLHKSGFLLQYKRFWSTVERCWRTQTLNVIKSTVFYVFLVEHSLYWRVLPSVFHFLEATSDVVMLWSCERQ